ncbi:glycosyltransferase family 2 protein [Bacteroides acidifaciens]|uniref:glycosyltransferase family 2 protein n=1 Tax=Bacteroides acidifaciens TaxID=85831 RepID=UPI00158C2CC7|nr:glycosyltransferase family 2 protein [Bacteroides acidifaciens]
MVIISVIVPIYKVEKYLRRCVDSILSQTYKDLEVILVDDGSPDRCGEICDEYKKCDSRVRVVHKQNGGLSDARNAGLQIATGEYVAFVDSDDWVAKDYLEKLYLALINTGSDICECEIIRTTGNVEFCECENTTICYHTQEALGLLIQDKVFHQYVWNKLYKRNCISDIYFEKGRTNEDEFWTYQVFGRAKHITKLGIALYFYFQRKSSIMGVGYNIKRLDALEAKQQRQLYIQLNFPVLSFIAKKNLFASCIYNGQMTLKFLFGDERKRAKENIYKVVASNKLSNKEIKLLSSNERLWFILSNWNFWLICKIRNWLGRGF